MPPFNSTVYRDVISKVIFTRSLSPAPWTVMGVSLLPLTSPVSLLVAVLYCMSSDLFPRTGDTSHRSSDDNQSWSQISMRIGIIRWLAKSTSPAYVERCLSLEAATGRSLEKIPRGTGG